LAPSCVLPGKSLKQSFSVCCTLFANQSHPGKSVALCFQPLTYFLPRSQRGFFRSLSQERKSSPLDSVTCALFAQNIRVYPVLPNLELRAAVPRVPWSLATGRRFALPAVSSYNKPCLFRSKSSLPSSQPYLRHPAHGDVFAMLLRTIPPTAKPSAPSMGFHSTWLPVNLSPSSAQ